MALCVDGPGGRAGWVLLFLLPKADTGWAHKRPAGLRSPSWGSGHLDSKLWLLTIHFKLAGQKKGFTDLKD